MHTEPRTVPGALAGRLRTDPDRPLLTYYDERTGERTELSAATLDNWVSKTANLLVDGAGAEPDEAAAVLLPAHWQAAAVLLGCLAAGVPVRTVASADAAPVEVAFATADRLDDARALRPAETYLLGLLPMAAPVADPPAGTVDYVREVRAFGDRFAAPPVADDAVALADEPPCGHADLAARARDRAAALGLAGGGRLLVPVDADPDPLTWLYAPLLAGASVVLCHHASADRLDAIADTEHVTTRA